VSEQQAPPSETSAEPQSSNTDQPAQDAATDSYARAMAALAAMEQEAETLAEVDPAHEPKPPATEGLKGDDQPATEVKTEQLPIDQPPAAPTGPSPEELAEFARQRQEQQRRGQQLAEQERRIAEKEAVFREHEGDPLKALEAMGHSYKDLTERVLKSGNTESEKPNPEIEKLRAAQEQLQSKLEAHEHERVVREYTDTVRQAISGEAERWQDLRDAVPDYADEVVELTRLEHERTGQILTIEQAADRLNAHVQSEVSQTISRLVSIPRYHDQLKAALAGKPNEPQPKPEQQMKPSTSSDQQAAPTAAAGGNGASRTLSNEDSAQVSRRLSSDADPNACRAKALALIESSTGGIDWGTGPGEPKD
jgi:hypothetical protein